MPNLPVMNNTLIPRRVVARFIITLCCATLAFLPAKLRAAEGAADGAASSQPRRKPDVKVWKESRAEGQKALGKGDSFSAELFFQTALEEAENFDARDYRLAESLEDLGYFYAAKGNAVTAEPLLRRAAAIRRGGPDSAAEAFCLLNLGMVCQKLAKYDDAEKSYQQAQDVLELKFGANHPNAVICMFHRAMLYDDLEKYAQAEPLYKTCALFFQSPKSKVVFGNTDAALHGVQISTLSYRPNYIYAFEALSHLSLLCLKQNRSTEAQAYFKQSFTVLEEQGKKASSELMIALNGIAARYIARNDFADAEVLLKRSVELHKRALGEKHIATQRTMAALAAVYEKEGKPAEAEKLKAQVKDLQGAESK